MERESRICHSWNIQARNSAFFGFFDLLVLLFGDRSYDLQFNVSLRNILLHNNFDFSLHLQQQSLLRKDARTDSRSILREQLHFEQNQPQDVPAVCFARLYRGRSYNRSVHHILHADIGLSGRTPITTIDCQHHHRSSVHLLLHSEVVYCFETWSICLCSIMPGDRRHYGWPDDRYVICRNARAQLCTLNNRNAVVGSFDHPYRLPYTVSDHPKLRNLLFLDC